MNAVYVLYREISDQLGLDKVVGVYSSLERAEQSDRKIAKHRTYIRIFDLDEDPVEYPRYVEKR